MIHLIKFFSLKVQASFFPLSFSPLPSLRIYSRVILIKVCQPFSSLNLHISCHIVSWKKYFKQQLSLPLAPSLAIILQSDFLKGLRQTFVDFRFCTEGHPSEEAKFLIVSRSKLWGQWMLLRQCEWDSFPAQELHGPTSKHHRDTSKGAFRAMLNYDNPTGKASKLVWNGWFFFGGGICPFTQQFNRRKIINKRVPWDN